MRPKIAVFAPIPKASESTTTRVVTGLLRNIRPAYDTSCRRPLKIEVPGITQSFPICLISQKRAHHITASRPVGILPRCGRAECRIEQQPKRSVLASTHYRPHHRGPIGNVTRLASTAECTFTSRG